MDCRETQTLLTAFHDGELPDADVARVEGHLRGCPECGRLLADLARADGAAGVPDPGPAYWDRFNARVADRIERNAEGPKAAVLRPKQGWMRQQLRYLVPAAAAAALVVVVVRYAGHPPVAPTPASPPAASGKQPWAPHSAGQPAAKGEMEPPATKKTDDAAISRSVPAESNRAAGFKAAPPSAVPGKRFPTAAREDQDRLAGRMRPEGKETVSRDREAAPAGIDAPLPPPPPANLSAPIGSPPVTASEGRLQAAKPEQEAPVAAAPPVEEAQPAAEAESASGTGIEKDAHDAETSPAMSLGTARAKIAPAPSPSRFARAASPCETARTLSSQGRLKEAEAAQRECLARDPSPPAQEKGLVFLAELLDRQARFAEADTVLAEVHRQFPKSRSLDLYRQQRPFVQKQQMPVPGTR